MFLNMVVTNHLFWTVSLETTTEYPSWSKALLNSRSIKARFLITWKKWNCNKRQTGDKTHNFERKFKNWKFVIFYVAISQNRNKIYSLAISCCYTLWQEYLIYIVINTIWFELSWFHKFFFLISGENASSYFEGNFRKAIWPILFVGQMFGVMPIIGIKSQSSNDLNFKWNSLRTFHSLFIVIAVSSYTLIAFWNFFENIGFSSIGSVSFASFIDLFLTLW